MTTTEPLRAPTEADHVRWERVMVHLRAASAALAAADGVLAEILIEESQHEDPLTIAIFGHYSDLIEQARMKIPYTPVVTKHWAGGDAFSFSLDSAFWSRRNAARTASR